MKNIIHKMQKDSGDLSIRVVEEEIKPEVFLEFYGRLEESGRVLFLRIGKI
jgi:hypothetical protein